MSDYSPARQSRILQVVQALQRYIAQANESLGERTPRERVLIFLGAFIAIALIWQMTLFSSQMSRLSQLNSQRDAVRSEIDQLETTIGTLQQEIAELENPDERIREEIASLESDIEGLTKGKGDTQSSVDFIALMPISEAITRLQSVIDGDNPVRIISFDRQMGEGVTSNANEDEGDVVVDQRRLRLVFEGRYDQTTELMARLEALNVPLVWRSLNYEVTDHPVARVTVRFEIYAPARLDQ